MSTDALWRIELLGHLRVVGAGATITRFRTQKTAALLAYLALNRDRVHSRDVLIELFWPGGETRAGRNSLSKALSSLRSQLEPPGTAPGSVIAASHATVELLRDAVTTDVMELETTLEAWERERGGARTAALERALALARGELLPGIYQDWIEPERERLRRRIVRAARALVAEHRSRGAALEAIPAARLALVLDPLAEDAHGDLLELYLETGQLRAARDHHSDLVRTLERELDAPPSARIREIGRELERRARTIPREPPASPEPPRSRSEASPGTVTFAVAGGPVPEALAALLPRHDGERVPDDTLAFAFGRPSDALAWARAGEATAGPFALDTSEVARGAATASGVARARAILGRASGRLVLVSDRTAALIEADLDPSLAFVPVAGSPRAFVVRARDAASRRVAPLELSRFFGREAELAAIREAFTSQATRLLVLVGPGGIGKTRLALAALDEIAPAFPGGAVFVPLADLSRPEAIPIAVSQALGLDTAGEPTDRIVKALAGRPSFLVLDNVEQLLPGAASFVTRLLEAAPTLRCLVTSRQRTAIPGERELRLDALEVPPEDGDLSELERNASVRIFVDRAQAARHDFVLTAENRGAVARLVQHLEGIPLALALAGGRSHVLAPSQLLERLRSRLDLATRDAAVPARHRTLRAAIEWSHDALPAGRQRFLATLAVFRGGFELESAEAVTGDAGALDALSDLCECSLVSSRVEGAAVRFRMLETIREFALERLSPDELARTRRRHAEHFVALVDEMESALAGPGQKASLDRISLEYDNLVAALAWCTGAGGSGELGLQLCALLVRYWFVRGLWSEGRRLTEEALARIDLRSGMRVAALNGAAVLATKQGDTPAARVLLEEALRVSNEVGQRDKVRGWVLNGLRSIALATGDLATARARSDDYEAFARALGDRSLVTRARESVAAIAKVEGDPARACEILVECLATRRELGDPTFVAIVLWDLADASLALGDLALARSRCEEALASATAIGFDDGVAQCSVTLAAIEAAEGRGAEARALCEKALAVFRRQGATERIATALLGLARASLAEGDAAAATRHLEEGFGLVRSLGNKPLAGTFAVVAGSIARARGDAAEAIARHREALAIAREIGSRANVTPALEGLAAVASARGEAEVAARLLGAAATLRGRRGALSPEESSALSEFS
jgi:non-specific serine/threonine protein kinase